MLELNCGPKNIDANVILNSSNLKKRARDSRQETRDSKLTKGGVNVSLRLLNIMNIPGRNFNIFD